MSSDSRGDATGRPDALEEESPLAGPDLLGQFANAIFEGSPAGKQIFGIDGTLLRTNEAFRRFMRLPSRNHGIGSWNILTDPTAQALGFARAFHLALHGETAELPNQSADLGEMQNSSPGKREEIHYDAALFPIKDESGTVRAVALTLWDTTDRRRAETALLRLTQAQNDFVSTVSHELRTPLTSIRGSLALLAADVPGALPEPLRPLVDIALRNTERLLTLINDLLDIQRIESASLDLELREVELPLLVAEALEDNQAFGAQLGVSFRLVRSDPGLRVLGDPQRLLQLLANLLSNAAKFSPPEAIVEITVERRDTRARVSVRDTGPGIPEDFQPRLFTRFAQADSSTTRQKGGTGLGLSICKALIEHMGGTIGFETITTPSPGHGTTFHFELPLLATARNQAPAAP